MPTPLLIDVLRWASLLAWLACAVWTASPFHRYMVGRGRGEDEWWAQKFLVSALMLAWGLRNVTMGPRLTGEAYTTTCVLQGFSALVALAVFRRRIRRAGWAL